MKNLMFAFALVAAVSIHAEESVEDYGGEITVWPKDPGLFLFINSQTKIAGDSIEKPISGLARDFSIDIRKIAGGAFDIRKAQVELKGLGAKGGIFIVDDPALPVTMVAPEDGWGIINVAPILADSPDAKRRDARLVKIIARTFANLHGISDPVMMPGCVMKPAVGLAGIDALVCSTFSPESHSKVSGYLAKAGYKQKKFGTYQDACEEGWAPKPTNSVQKAIWDKVHQLPTKPLTIQRESERKR